MVSILRQAFLVGVVPASSVSLLVWSVLSPLGAFSATEVLHIASAVAGVVLLLVLAQLVVLRVILRVLGQSQADTLAVLLTAVALQGGAFLAIRRLVVETEPIGAWTYAQAVGVVLSALLIASLLWTFFGPRTPRFRRWLELSGSAFVIAFVLASLSFVAATHSSAGRHGEVGRSGKSVVLITVDSFRYDRATGPLGQRIAPNIVALGEQGTAFTRFFVHAPYTWASLASIFTSSEGPVHGVRANGQVLKDESLTLSEILTDAGYVCYSPGDLALPLMGLQQGFVDALELRESIPIRLVTTLGAFAEAAGVTSLGRYGFGPDSSIGTTLKGIRFIRNNSGRPFFLWIHYYSDPHGPYFAPRYYVDRFTNGRSSWLNGTNEQLLALNGNPRLAPLLRGRTPAPEDLTYLSDLYDAEVAVMDEQVGRVLGALRSSGSWDHTLVILTADHGEDLNDRGHFLHSNNLFDELIHVPLFVKDGAQPGKKRVDRLARGIDIAPTVLDSLGIRAPAVLRGRSLLRPPESDALEGEDWCYSESLSYGEAWPYDDFGLTYTSNTAKLIDLPAEAREKVFCQGEYGQLPCEDSSGSAAAAEMRRRIVESFGLTEISELVPQSAAEIGDEQRKMLKALGYLD